MVKQFLITRPNHDIITSYLHDFSKEIVRTVKGAQDIHITNLEGPNATRVKLEKALSKEKPKLVFLNGHGDRKKVAGHKDEIILDNKNVDLTKNKIIYSLSCDSLTDLGEISVKKGANAYIGYNASFMLVRDPSREGTPSKDKNALPFKKICVTMINSLVFGMSAETSIEKTKEEYRKLIRSYGTSEDDPYGDTPLIRFALAWNLEFLDMHGDPNAAF